MCPKGLTYRLVTVLQLGRLSQQNSEYIFSIWIGRHRTIEETWIADCVIYFVY